MAINTPNDLFSLTLRRAQILGEGQPASAQMISDCMDATNAMLVQWNRKKTLIWNEIDVSFVSTGQLSYTVGPGQNFDTPRPDRLSAAYVRLLPVSGNNPVDQWLTIIVAHEDYAKIPLKHMQSYPLSIWYDSAWPTGLVYPYPVPPENQFEIHLVLKNQISQFTSTDQAINLPPEYIDAISWNLALRLEPAYGMSPNPAVARLAVNALNTIRQANNQVAVLGMPMGFPSGGYGNFPPWQAGMTGNN